MKETPAIREYFNARKSAKQTGFGSATYTDRFGTTHRKRAKAPHLARIHAWFKRRYNLGPKPVDFDRKAPLA
jgi:hypothetical protein